ncbi:aspartate/glutamate racemase family protein [Bacillus sp. DX1.1]|uniref:aspartate/glutamate racemase family protein n=1 Tax=unclassified Bacillus (in: firmicutes) TaxID=185979 RepID=UPI00256FB6F4|nr:MULTISPECIES: aspartate/glutamate racemase family protein [unclassified Bacillus (in: firmicutes)]MDM5155122.1 aspartate/glutamate racemase family protein [Bacillus sp. DX1.1]WJE79451.1 aspartate/glutamate racemase family protein [Bacillus sp. DX3.1]
MKVIGLIGGLSWESTSLYYKHINTLTLSQYDHNAKLVLYSMDFGEVTTLLQNHQYEEVQNELVAVAKKVENSGADCILMCSNTVHQFAEEVQQAVSIPLLHIGDVSAEEIVGHDVKRIGLLGTKQTMEQDFYKTRLANYGIETIIPQVDEREFIHHVILHELSKGIISQRSKERFLQIIAKLIENGAEGILLGCTEIPLLISQKDLSIPVFDTAFLHAKTAVQFAG